VGGIEAEAAMLGQPVSMLVPQVVGFRLSGKLKEGTTATDLVLTATEALRKHGVVGKFVEFYGPGISELPLADRATIANMAPEYGATMGFFGLDEQTLEYLRATGRTKEQVALVKAYYEAQGMWGIPHRGQVDYTKSLDLDLDTIVPCVSGPKRPQDRIDVPALKSRFIELFQKDIKDGGYGKPLSDLHHHAGSNGKAAHVERAEGGGVALAEEAAEITHGSVLIAAITSCTNTSNPSVMLAAGLVAKKAVERGLRVPAYVKTSLAPGSRVVTDYLEETGLQKYLNELGFNLVGYGCTTCIGNSGPLDGAIEAAIKEGDLVSASVLSGNRNFEARVHPSIKANFLMSPPLVVAYALAGRVDIDLTTEPLGIGSDGKPVYLKELWPSLKEIQENILKGLKPEMFQRKYSTIAEANPEWNEIQVTRGERYAWNEKSTYIQAPPFFAKFSLTPGKIAPLAGLRPLALLGDSVTTDHISPAGSFKADTPAGRYLLENGVAAADFNSYGSRRGNDRVMTRGTFANVRIKNRMADGKEGGFTKLQPDGKVMAIFDACQEYAKRGTGLIIFGGVDYGMGSSRDWAAKGTALLGVKAVVAKSFERIHRSNLLGMGVLPLEFPEGQSAEALGLDGTEVFSLPGLGEKLQPRERLDLVIQRADGRVDKAPLVARIDTLIEVEYYRHGGILPYVLRQLLKS